MNRSNPNQWGWIYFGFHGKMRPRVLCSCSGVHPKRGLEPIPVSSPDDWPELCRSCYNQGIQPVPFTELMNGTPLELDNFMHDSWAKSGISGEIARSKRRDK